MVRQQVRPVPGAQVADPQRRQLRVQPPRLGRVVLAAAGVLQTIPSLALLLFMIPLMMWLVGKGTGAPPAIAALFLYSLLPIVRNTHAGLIGIPPSLRESAEAIGLPPAAILWRVELPLAAPTILAGVRTAAVINVGFATLGRVGFEGRFDYGAVGNVVILASRLSDAAEPGEILLSQRLNAAVRPFGLTYSRFIAGLGKAGVMVDRKVLSDLAIREPAAFEAIVGQAKSALG